MPGFYLGGNLYRPLGRTGPFPGIVSPHGHWAYGRLENSNVASVPGRCINLARQGYVVFSYDMVGYDDTMQMPHVATGKREQLWGFGLLGMQLWDSIRAVDFLESLPDVDRDAHRRDRRIGRGDADSDAAGDRQPDQIFVACKYDFVDLSGRLAVRKRAPAENRDEQHGDRAR